MGTFRTCMAPLPYRLCNVPSVDNASRKDEAQEFLLAPSAQPIPNPCPSVDIFPCPKCSEARAPLRNAGFVIPGSYLLLRGLAPDYHRRADVSLPGSGWDRVGPSG